MRFTKMQGCGNDYIYVDCFSERVERPEELAERFPTGTLESGETGSF